MAKDPAVLWYFSDWFTGTATLTRHQKGCYMDLLSIQFNNGRLSLEEIKTVLGSDFGTTWPTLQKKFKEENGLYYNERLEEEQNKRKKYSESRRKNRNGSHMSPHMENEDINENVLALPNWLNKKAWEAWGKHRSEIRKPLTPTAVRLQLKFLEQHKEDHVQIIKNSIESRWMKFYPLKKGENGRQPKTYIEPNDSHEVNERRTFLEIQAKGLAEGMKFK